MTTIHVAHSPDSDDAFMFYALAAGKIDTEGLTYVHELQDIESLNQRAMRGELEVTAVSIHAYAYLSDKYSLLPHGASMGDRYGPRLVAREPADRSEVKGKRIAIPGPLTSAYLALQLYEPDFTPVFMPFDAIEDAVVNGDVDMGLLIHEGQLTFAERGLHLVADMGEWWFQETGLPLPLGGNVVRKDLGPDLTRKVSRHLRDSIAYGLQHRVGALDLDAGRVVRRLGPGIVRVRHHLGDLVRHRRAGIHEMGRCLVLDVQKLVDDALVAERLCRHAREANSPAMQNHMLNLGASTVPHCSGGNPLDLGQHVDVRDLSHAPSYIAFWRMSPLMVGV